MKILWLFLLFTSSAWAAYSPGVFIADPTTTTQRASVSAAGALKVDNSGVTQPVSGTFWQATQPVSSTQLPASLGQKTMANSLACSLSSDQSAIPVTGTFWQATQPVSIAAAVQTLAPKNSTAAFSQTSVTTTASTISAPANAVRVLIQGDSTNTDCIRYRFDGTAATATVGLVAQAGQDSGQLDSGMSVSVAACSGTQKVNVQYFAQ